MDQVTKIAYGMLSVYGMNSKVGNVSFYGMSQDQFSKPYSADTATMIDEEVRSLLDQQYKRAQDLLKEKRQELHILAKALLEKEVLLKSDVINLLGERPWPTIETFSEVVAESIEHATVQDSNEISMT